MNAASTETLDLTEANRANWAFIGEPWQQDADGIIAAGGGAVDENLAFYTARAFGDFEAEYEFRWECVWTTGAFVFRARDPQHYYVLDFPAVGQQYRAEHFWATLSKVDQRGFREVLSMQMVPGVTSSARVWQHVRLQVTGDQIKAWVNKRLAVCVRDTTYAEPGYVGLNTYNAISPANPDATAGHGDKSSFRNVRISGPAATAPAFAPTPAPVRTWNCPHPDPAGGSSRIARAGNGDVLVSPGGNRLLRSADNGRTWTADEPLPESHQISSMVSQADGSVAMIRPVYPGMPTQLLKSVSTDHGRTWSEYRQVKEFQVPGSYPYENYGGSTIVQTRDGGLVIFGTSSGGVSDIRKDGRCLITFEAFGTFALRSDDGGETWSDPVDVDGDPRDENYWLFVKCGCEPSATELKDGTLLVLNRPIWSPFIWESRSFDGGRSWTPAARGPFPLYATCHAMTTTTSGAVLIGGRFPGLAVQLSQDDGYNWQCYQIDACAWANGAMMEVEPDVVLFTYGGRAEFRSQLLRVTRAGLEPVR